MSEGQGKPPAVRQSTIARDFSATLDNAFGMGDTPQPDLNPDITGLSQSLDQNKRAVTAQREGPEAVQAPLRATEQHLQQSGASADTPSGTSANVVTQSYSAQRASADRRERELSEIARDGADRSSMGRTADQPGSLQNTRPSAAKEASYSIPSMPGAMPQTPGEDDFQKAWADATPERPEQR